MFLPSPSAPRSIIINTGLPNPYPEPRLLTLPLEIRQLIYAHIPVPELIEGDISHMPDHLAPDQPGLDLLKFRPNYPMTQVCRQLKSEYTDWFFTTTWTRIDCHLCVAPGRDPVILPTNLDARRSEAYRVWKVGVDYGLRIRRLMLRLSRPERDNHWAAHVFIHYYPEAGWSSVQYRLAMIFPEPETITASLQPGLRRLRSTLDRMCRAHGTGNFQWRDIERLIDALSRPGVRDPVRFLPREPPWEPDNSGPSALW